MARRSATAGVGALLIAVIAIAFAVFTFIAFFWALFHAFDAYDRKAWSEATFYLAIMILIGIGGSRASS